jgi:hypothetical protein
MQDCTITIKLQSSQPNTYGLEIKTDNCYWFKAVRQDYIPGSVAAALVLMETFADKELDAAMRIDEYVPF